MLQLDPARVRWIFIHTAAYSGEVDATEIDRWHRSRGRDAIGYHYVVRRSGHVEPGRSLAFAGAHIEGCNTRSIGICCEGHGDYEEHTTAQRGALLALCRALMAQYHVPARSVLGHREVNGLVDRGLVGDHYRTHKTCPGTRVDMNEIRTALGGSEPMELPEPPLRLEYPLGIVRPDVLPFPDLPEVAAAEEPDEMDDGWGLRGPDTDV